jgi:alpha-D-ribose 1-methylphosphonate 5-triphosphate synthase subunit PhnH
MVERGFDAPTLAAQRVFRTLLTALSEPGRVLPLAPCCAPPTALDPAAAALVLALADGDTPLWLDPTLGEAAEFLRFHTGAPIVASPGEALFLVATAGNRPPLGALQPGSAEYPDRSATLILAVSALGEGQGWRLSGPGIAGTRRCAVSGLDARFVGEWQANHGRFPLGVDVVLAARDRIAGLPRSTQLEA